MIDNSCEVIKTPIKGDELLLGAGNNKDKQLCLPDEEKWADMVSIDIDPESKPDVLWDLMHIPLPFEDETFKEIHAYDVLEHLGQQGDYKQFFALFEEFYRILKPEGYIMAATPIWDGVWAWGDPGHTRIINEGTINFLCQENYRKDVGRSSMTDYRHCYKADFSIEHSEEVNGRLCFILKKI